MAECLNNALLVLPQKRQTIHVSSPLHVNSICLSMVPCRRDALELAALPVMPESAAGSASLG
jgi:hypothetical protein